MAQTIRNLSDIVVGKEEGPAVSHVEDTHFLPLQDAEANRESLKNIETVAFVVEKPQADFKLMPVVFDEIQSDEYLIEMKYSGICHTDLVVQQGLMGDVCQYPAIFGHEGAGIVKAIGSDVRDKSIKIGDPVLLSFVTCNECEQCNAANPAGCWNFIPCNFSAQRFNDKKSASKLKDGRTVGSMFFGHSSFSKLSVVKDQGVIKYPYDDLENLGLYAATGCGFQTGAGAILNVLKPEPEQSVVVFGLGGVGLTALMAAKYLDVQQILAVDIQDSKLALAKDLGATHVINSRESDVVAEIKKITAGGAAFALDCTGIIPVLESAIECLRPFGIACSIGVPPAGKGTLKIDALSFLLENKRYHGLIEGGSVPPEFIPKLVKMHKDGRFPLDKLVKMYSLKDFDQAVMDMHDGKTIKAVIEWKDHV